MNKWQWMLMKWVYKPIKEKLEEILKVIVAIALIIGMTFVRAKVV